MKLLFKRFAIVNLGLLILIILSFAGFKLWEYTFYLSYVPKELNAYQVVYRKEVVWGFGPGGDEAGIRIYALPATSTKKIQTQGIEYMRSLPSNTNGGRERRGHYQDWFETPIEVTQRWQDHGPQEMTYKFDRTPPSIGNYLSRGFISNVDPDVEKMINEIIRNSGSYYAYGRTGIIIIAPEIRRAIYLYSH